MWMALNFASYKLGGTFTNVLPLSLKHLGAFDTLTRRQLSVQLLTNHDDVNPNRYVCTIYLLSLSVCLQKKRKDDLYIQ